MSRTPVYIAANTEFQKTYFLAIRESLTDMRSKDTFPQRRSIGYWQGVREPEGWPCRECPWGRREWRGPSANHIPSSSLIAKDARRSTKAILASNGAGDTHLRHPNRIEVGQGSDSSHLYVRMTEL